MKISIITATYNSGKTVRDTLDSILRQSYRDYELIIKDGGSNDDTLETCREYESLFGGRMHIISAPDKGIYDAMNQGITAAHGEVIGILNSDDFYTSDDILQTIADAFKNNPEIDAVYGDVHYVKKDDITQQTRYYSSKSFRRSLMRLGFMPAHPSFYCRKATYETHTLDTKESKDATTKRYFDISYKVAADFENLLRMIFVGRIKCKYIEKDFVTMRTGGASSSGIKSHLQINKDHKRALRTNGVYSNSFILSLRYLYKVIELIRG